MTKRFIPDSRWPQRPAHSINLLQQLGIEDGRAPEAGTLARFLKANDGALVSVWVAPRRLGDRFRIRTMCRCPNCFQHLAASRLHQHKCEAK